MSLPPDDNGRHAAPFRPLPSLGRKIGSGGIGSVYVDLENPELAIKVFKTSLEGAPAHRILRLVAVAQWARPSDRATLTSRFSWPIECFGEGNRIHGYSMPLADPDRCYFDLTTVGRTRTTQLQLKYFTDEAWWQSRAVQSSQPDFSSADRCELVIDLIEAITTLPRYDLAFGDISSNNICAQLGSLPEVFIFDVDSIGNPAEVESESVQTPGWRAPEGLNAHRRTTSLTALLVWRLFTGLPNAYPSGDIVDFLVPLGGSSISSLLVSAYSSGNSEPLIGVASALRQSRDATNISLALARSTASRFARSVVDDVDERSGPDSLGLRARVEAQIDLEDGIDSATGAERRRLTSRAALTASEFELDVLPDIGVLARPNSQGQLHDLIYDAEFVTIATHLATGGLGNLEDDQWLPRAVQHAIVEAGDTTLESTTEPGRSILSWTWPAAGFVNAAMVEIRADGQKPSRQIFVRRPGERHGVAEVQSETPTAGQAVLRLAVQSVSGNVFVAFDPVLADYLITRPPERPAPVPSPQIRQRVTESPVPQIQVVDPVQVASDLAASRQDARQRRKRRITVSAAIALVLLGITWVGWELANEYLMSPDGRQMVFASDRDGDWEIYVRDRDGSVRQLTDNDYDDRNPVWSPDGKHIGFEAIYDGDWELLRMNTDGSDVRSYFFNSDADRELDWSQVCRLT